MKRTRLLLVALAGSLVALGGAGAPGVAGASGGSGFVYTMSNAASGNSVIAYARASDGTLAPNGVYATGGSGTGQPRLGSQGSVVLTADRRRLLVANPGSGDVFAVGANGTLTLTDREPSNGDRRESIAIRGSLVYVLNTGSPNNISGYTLDHSGNLTPLRGSIRALSREGAAGGYLAAFPSGGSAPPGERKVDARAVDPEGEPALASLVVAPDGVTIPFDDPAVSEALRAALAAPWPDVLSTLVVGESRFAGAITAVRDGDRVRLELDPFARIFPAELVEVGAGLFGHTPAPAARSSRATAAQSHGLGIPSRPRPWSASSVDRGSIRSSRRSRRSRSKRPTAPVLRPSRSARSRAGRSRSCPGTERTMSCRRRRSRIARTSGRCARSV